MSRKPHTLTQASANKLRERAVSLSQDEGKARLALAEAIYELYYGAVEIGDGEMPLWKYFGFASWFDYVETEVGIHVTTAAGYRMVHDVFMVRIKGEWDRSLTPPFTKMKALTRVVDAKNVNSWLKKAQRMSCCELEEAVAEHLYGKRRRGASRHFTALLTDRQLASANAILHVAADQFPGAETRGEILMRVLEQWDGALSRRTKRHLKLVRKTA